MTHEIREATPGDAEDVARLLDAAMLEFDREGLVRRVEAGDVLVAVSGGRTVGVCVLTDADEGFERADPECTDADYADLGDGGATEIESIAVHRSRRGRGIGRALVDAAATRSAGPLVARFHEQVRPFYEALGFEIRESEIGDVGRADRDTRGGDDSTGSGDDDTSRDDNASRDDRLYGVLK